MHITVSTCAATDRFTMISDYIKNKNQWVCYLDKDTIINPKTGEVAYNDDPSTWSSFSSALEFVESHKGYTLGYELGQNPTITAVHIGNCLTPDYKSRNLDIDRIIYSMESYVELDKEGNGLTFLSANGGKRTLVDQLKSNKISKDGIVIELLDFNQCISLTGLHCFIDSTKCDGSEAVLQFDSVSSIVYNPMVIDLIYELFLNDKEAVTKSEKVSEFDDTKELKDIRPFLRYKLNYLVNTNLYFKNLWYRTEPSDKGKEYDDINLIARIKSRVTNSITEVKRVFIASPYYEAKDVKEAKMFSKQWPKEKLSAKRRLADQPYSEDEERNPIVDRIVEKALFLSEKADFMDYDNDLNLLLDPIYETAIDLNTDMECSKLFMNVYGKKMLFCSEDNCWYIYNGQYWEIENNNDLKHLRKYGAELTDRLNFVLNWGGFPKNQKKALYSNVKKFSNVTSFKRILEAARSVNPVGSSVFNTKKHLLKVGNGTLDLKTGMLLPDNPKDLFSVYTNVHYYRSYPEPKKFIKFLNDIFKNDKELIEYVHRLLGYCITGETKEQLFFVFYGTGANGKSTLINILQSVLNDYVGSFDSYALAKKNDGSGKANPTLIQNRYCRLVSVSEKKDRSELDISLIKAITGGDKINTRMLFQNNVKPFAPMYKIVFTANKLPKVDWNDYAIQRRYRVIPFNKTLKGEEIDPDLEKKILANEKETILKWLVEGAKMYYEDGLGEEPQAVKMAILTALHSDDPVLTYADNRIDVTQKEEDMIQASDIKKDYVEWCKNNNLPAVTEKVLGTKLADILREKGVKKQMKTTNRCIHYIGIRFKDCASEKN